MRQSPSYPGPGVESSEATVDTPAGTRQRTKRRRRHQFASIRVPLYRRPLVMVIVTLLLLALLWTGLRIYRAQAAYQDASEQVDALQLVASEDFSTLSAADLADIERRLDTLRLQLRQLEDATSLPLGSDSVVAHLPWLGPRYESAREVLQLGLILADSGASSAQIGREALFALDQSGISANTASANPTWLDVVSNHEAEIQRIREQIEHAESIRAGINSELLPARTQSQLDAFDRAMNRLDNEFLMSLDLDVLQVGLGADRPARYLLLFQNPAELRPSGGFPGTIAIVTIERGQLTAYEFMDVRDLTYDYIDQRESSRPQPWPIQQYFPQDGFLLHDATWFADFPKSGAEVMSMYAETDWPPIDGVVAVEPDAISRMLDVTGPVTVTIDNEERHVTAENFYDEIERQRRRRRAGVDIETTHKEAVGVIGEAILERLKMADRQALTRIVEELTAAADQRDLQAYAANPELQATMERRHWTGSLIPNPELPTLAVTFANVAVNKASLEVQPRMALLLDEAENGQRRVMLELLMEHTGTNDPLYDEFQRWWIEVTLPAGSSLLTSHPDAIPNPESPNGGSYLIEIVRGQTGRLSISFSMPDSDTLLVRRQPGLIPLELSVTEARCEETLHETLQTDLTLDLVSLCR